VTTERLPTPDLEHAQQRADLIPAHHEQG